MISVDTCIHSHMISVDTCIHSHMISVDLSLSQSLSLSLSLSLCASQIEKVLQQGDITESVEPYLKARDLDKKTLEKHKVSAHYFCQQLGQYRMPFAWTAINVLDIIAGQ